MGKRMHTQQLVEGNTGGQGALLLLLPPALGPRLALMLHLVSPCLDDSAKSLPQRLSLQPGEPILPQ